MLLHFLQQNEHKKAFLELANIVANADGFVNLKERGGLRMIAAELGLPAAATATSRSLEDILGCVQDEHMQHIFLVEKKQQSKNDNENKDEEKKHKKKMKRLFGISEEKYDAFKEWVIRVDKLKTEGVKLILNMP